MQKKVTIITIALVVVIFFGTMVGLYFMTNSSSNSRQTDLQSKIDSTQAEIDTLSIKKDINGFTATEVVKAFFYEVQTDSTARAKLYLAPEVQNMDINATLRLGSDLANITMGENQEEVVGDNRTVGMNFILPTNETTARIFELSKNNGAWKIIGVSAE
jgi:hypothetical protein